MPTKRPVPGHNDYLPILQRHLEPEHYEMFACGDSGPSVGEVEAFASEVGVRLPEDFVDFSVSKLGGLYLAVKEEIWPRGKLWDIGEFWSFLYGLYVYGFGRQIPEYMDICVQTPIFREQSGTNLVPCITIISDANIYGFDPDGVIRRWDHETGECEPVNRTFLEAFEFEVAELAARKVKKLEEGGRDKRSPSS